MNCDECKEQVLELIEREEKKRSILKGCAKSSRGAPIAARYSIG